MDQGPRELADVRDACRGTSLMRKRPPTLGSLQASRQRPTVGSHEEAVSYERGATNPVWRVVGFSIHSGLSGLNVKGVLFEYFWRSKICPGSFATSRWETLESRATQSPHMLSNPGWPRWRNWYPILPNNQCQHRTLHIQVDVLPYTLC